MFDFKSLKPGTMKKFYSLLAFVFLTSMVFSQPWIKNLPQNKAKENLTFFDYKNAFEAYWAPFKVDKGFYVENGVQKKAVGWKQFKRWEYNMEGQINPATGEFPKKTAEEVFEQYLRDNPQNNPANSTNSASWTGMGPSSSAGGYNGVGRINCIAFHPSDNNTFWVGAASGGLWVTTNGGSSWTCLTDNNGVLAVSDIIIPTDFTTSNTIYIATGDKDHWDNRSIGVLKSTNGGSSWSATGITYGISSGSMVYRLLLDPSNNQNILAATSGGVYKTTNGGTTWSTQLTSTSFIDMEYKPGDFNTLYGSTTDGSIYVSSNGGTSWTQAFSDASAYRIELAVSANQPAWVYALAANSASGLYGIYKSTNSGTSYTQVYSGTTLNLLGWNSNGADAGGQGWYDLSLAASASDANTLLVGGVNTWRSTNGGTSWAIVNHWSGSTVQAVHADKHTLKYRGNGDLFECNDGGVYISINNGTSWTDRTNGMVTSQMYKLGVSQTVATEVITGLQDNGTKLLSGGTWADVKGGDGMECLIDYSDVNVQYGTYVYGQISKTTNHWGSSTNIQPASAGDGAWVTPYIIDPVTPQTLYAGYADVWKTTDRGTTWTQISTMAASSKIRSMAIAPSNNQVLYVAATTNIWKTINGGTSWTEITGTLPVGSGSITYITVKNDDPNTLWVTLGGYNANTVYQSVNGGTAWTNISTGLPSLPAYSIVQNKQAATEVQLYVGTELGVYFKKGSDNWIAWNTGLPNVKIGEIEIYYASNPQNSKLKAATYGRGLWETPVYFASSAMTYVSSTTTQNNISKVAPNTTNQEIIGIQIVTSGDLTPLSATSFTLNTTGSTNPATDIANAKVFYTGTSSVFAATAQFGSTSVSPNGTFTITGTQALSTGTNYFWLAYDVPATAVVNNYLDAQCTSLTVGTARTPTVTSPTGSRQIGISYCTASATTCDEYISNVKLGTINNSSACTTGGYADYTAVSTTMTKGATLPITVTNGVPYSSDQCGIWVDWNNNGDFSDDAAITVTGTPGGGPYTASIACAASTSSGPKRLRIRIHYNNETTSPCGVAAYGEVEDYTINVADPAGCVSLNYLAMKAQSLAGTYTDLGTSGSVITTANFDDANSSAQNIGFTFTYDCQSFTQFVLNTNGFIKLGNTAPSAAALFFDGAQTAGGGIFNSTNAADVNLISPFNHDLTSGTGTPEYRVYTSGTTPNRVCTIQFKNVRDKTTSPAQQYNNMQFQVKLYETSNIIEFVYGDWTASANASAFKTSACGLKGTSNADNQLLLVNKGSTATWDAANFANANYSTTATLNFGNPPTRPKPDAGRTYRFIPIYSNDLTVGEIYSLGDASLYYSNPQPVSVNIRNTGSNTQTNIPVTLTISGANSFTDTKTISSLASGANAIVSFASFTASATGSTSVLVSVPNDDYNPDNTRTWTQNTNYYTCNYSTTAGPSSGWGYSTAGGSGIFYAKYHVTGTAKVNSVKAYIYNDAASVGQTVFGIVLTDAGGIVAQSANYVIQAADLGTWHTFTMASPPTLTNENLYAGFGVTAGTVAYYAMGVQNENPSRATTYYYSDITGSGLTVQDPVTFIYRYMVGATLSAVTLNAPVTTAATRGAPYSSPVSIPVTVTGFSNITALSLRLDYNPTLLTFTGSANVNSQLTGLIVNDLTVSSSLHKVMMIWSDLAPRTLAAGDKIVDLNFTYITGTAALTWNNTASSGTECEYADAIGNPMTDTPTATYYINGEVHYQPGFMVSGVFRYNNTAMTLLDNVKVVLKQGNSRVDSVTTNASGAYSFATIQNGTYKVLAYTGKAWSSVNATDAIKVQRHFAGLEILTEPVRLLAADVNLSNSINATDAIKIKRRFSGLDTYFDRGDWTFAKPTTGWDTIVVSGAAVTQDFYGLCVGDVNGSNVPAAGKSFQTAIRLVPEGEMEITAGEEFELPVRIEQAAELGAVSLVITYPSESLSIKNVSIKQGDLLYKATGSELRIAWSELEPMLLGSRDALITLHLKASQTLNSTQALSFGLTGESELADGYGAAIPNVTLTMPALKTAAGTSNGDDLLGVVSVYPNPTGGEVKIEYQLNGACQLSVEITDVYGQVIRKQINTYTASGKYHQQFDLSDVSAGVYMVKISCGNYGKETTRTMKLVKRK